MSNFYFRHRPQKKEVMQLKKYFKIQTTHHSLCFLVYYLCGGHASAGVKAYRSTSLHWCCRSDFGSKRGQPRRRQPPAGRWRSLGRWRRWTRPDWAPPVLSQSPVGSADSACRTSLPGCTLVWGLANTNTSHNLLKMSNLAACAG